MTNDRVWQLRCNDGQLESWKAAAALAGLSANAWCRRALDEAAAFDAAQVREGLVEGVPVVAVLGGDLASRFKGPIPRK